VVLGSKKPGISIVEFVFFIFLAGIFYASIGMMIPKKRPGKGIEEFFLSLNDLSSLAMYEALSKQCQTRLEFKKNKDTGRVQVRAEVFAGLDEKDRRLFKSIETGFIESEFVFPENVALSKWWTDAGKSGSEDDEFVVNFSYDGFPQMAIIHLSETFGDQIKQFSAVVNPFSIASSFKKTKGFWPMLSDKKDE